MPNGFSTALVDRRGIGIAATEAVMVVRHLLRHAATDVSAQEVEYDLPSYDAKGGHLHFMETRCRVDSADAAMITRHKVLAPPHPPDKFTPAIAQVGNRFGRDPFHACGPLATREPPFKRNAIQFSIKSLLQRAEVPK